MRLELLLPPCPSLGENCLRLEDEASSGEKQGKSGVLVGSAERLHRALPEFASPVHRCFQFSLGPLVRFLPPVPVVAWATVLIQCISFFKQKGVPSPNTTHVPFELSQRACPSLLPMGHAATSACTKQVSVMCWAPLSARDSVPTAHAFVKQ